MDENIEKQMYKSDEEVSDEVKKLIIKSFEGRKSSWNTRGSHVFEKFMQTEKLGWSIKVEFDQSILIWHIATELCLNPSDTSSLSSHSEKDQIVSRQMISSLLSRYMMYLLVFHPLMLTMGIGRLKFKDTYIEAMKFFDDRKSARDALKGTSHNVYLNLIVSLRRIGIRGGDGESMGMREGCEQLRKGVNTRLNLTIGKEDKSKFVVFHGCQLASQLEKIEDIQVRWEMLSEVWVEMLSYAASKCKGRYHCQQLRRGGELLTHVWLLLAHFGLTDHFQIPSSSSIAELIVT